MPQLPWWSGNRFAFNIVFGTTGSMMIFTMYKQQKRRKKMEEKYGQLTEQEKIALQYIDKRLMEKRWRDHLKVMGVQSQLVTSDSK